MTKFTSKLTSGLFILTLLTSVFGQTNEDFRKTAPAPLAPRPFVLPTPFETVLPNGLKVVVIEDKRLPLVNFQLAIPGGEIRDPKDSLGITSMVTGLLKEGTKTRSSKQIAQEIENIGGSIFAGASDDNTTVSASALSTYSSDILKLLADVTLNPSFPENEIKLAKDNTLQGLEAQRAQPGFLADEAKSKILWGDHPYGIVSPTKETVSSITREKLADFHKQMMIPNNAVLVIVGSVDKVKITAEVKALFGSWKKGPNLTYKLATPPTRTEKTLTIIDRPGSSQSTITMGNLAISRNDPDYFPMMVLNQVYGGGASARLFMNIREAKGYTYGAYSDFDTRRMAGSFGSSADVRNEVTGASLKEFFFEMNRLRTETVPAKELTDTKSYLTGVFPLQLETQNGLLGQFTNIQLNNLPANYLQTYRDKINAVTAADIQRVANKYVQPDKIAVVIVGDTGEILNQVKPYSSKIEIFDANGKKLDIASFNQPANTGSPANANGKWDLKMNAMGQNLDVTLDLKQDGDKVSGEMNSMLGKGTVEGGKISGNKLTATAKTTFQGQALNLKISGTIDGDNMKGSIDSGFPGAPAFSFAGKRSGGEMPKPTPAPATQPASTSSNLTGNWTVETNAQGTPVTIDMKLKQDGEKLTGDLSSAIGNGKVTSGTFKDGKIEAVMTIDFQGNPLEVKLSGTVENGNKMKGNLTPQGLGIGDLPFTAAKAN
jgi:zinc protease